jgi:hypothetical protein
MAAYPVQPITSHQVVDFSGRNRVGLIHRGVPLCNEDAESTKRGEAHTRYGELYSGFKATVITIFAGLILVT